MTDKPTVHLRIRRSDLIDQIIGEVQQDHRKEVQKAQDAVRKASQQFVEAVGAEALRIAGPTIKELEKVAAGGSWRAEFTWRPEVVRWSSGREYAPDGADNYMIQVRNGDRYNGTWHSLAIPVNLTPELIALRKAAMDAEKVRADLETRDTRVATMKIDASRKIIRQAIKELPEGEKLLEAVRQLRLRAEASVKKNPTTLLPES